MNNKVDYLVPGEDYTPKQPDWERIKDYVDVDPTGPEMKAHERDSLKPKPQILRPPPPRAEITMDDVTDFPF